MKRTLIAAGILLFAGWLQTASAFTYGNTDLLLVFRQAGFQDVEFDLGSVSNYLGRAAGFQTTVTNWNLALVKSNFNNTLSGTSFALLACTGAEDASRRAWLTDGAAGDTPANISGSKWGQLRSKIDFVGVQAEALTGTNATEVYVVSPSDSSSYTFIASGGGLLDVGTISGLAPFNVESPFPAAARFYEVSVDNNTPKGPSVQVGTFTLSQAGVLTFAAAGAAPVLTPAKILGVTRSGGVSTVSFTSGAGGNYRLRSIGANGLTTPLNAWTILGQTVAGTGGTLSLTDTTSSASTFYIVETTP